MKQPKNLAFTCAALAAAGVIFALPTSGQQAAQPTQEAVDIARLIGELEIQQNQLTANQDAMEKKLAAIDEQMRQAKIFASRGGGGAKK